MILEENSSLPKEKKTAKSKEAVLRQSKEFKEKIEETVVEKTTNIQVPQTFQNNRSNSKPKKKYPELTESERKLAEADAFLRKLQQKKLPKP